MSPDDQRWRAKLAAWTHDPAEKALVLLRDPAGHEGGTVRALYEALGLAGDEALETVVRRADRWASAADRPQFPRDREHRYPPWAQVRFDSEGVLIHPLSGDSIEIGPLDIDPAAIKAVSLDHFNDLIHRDGERIDARRTALAFWRFGPQSPAPELGALWRLLPADTRVPDHDIWTHLDLCAAFAGAMVEGDVPALLTVSLGPVQGFIEQARSTSDLWAGSHLLARAAWEAARPIVEAYGPDSVLFPQLRGLAVVDRWLVDDMGLEARLFQSRLHERKSEANPLFMAALPNRLVAVVPARAASTVAAQTKAAARAWLREYGEAAMGRLLEAAGAAGGCVPCQAQLERQIAALPEAQWATVPWSLAADGDTPAPARLREAARPFVGAPGGVLQGPAWAPLERELKVGGSRFFRPNPGTLYGALYEVLDRAGAAAKTVRPFDQACEEGFRCSVCGEREWLTLERDQLGFPPGTRKEASTLWTRVANEKPRWAGKGEHLCGVCAIKRVWPDLISDEIGGGAQRHVASTRTLALAPDLERIVTLDQAAIDRSPILCEAVKGAGGALPRRLAAMAKNGPGGRAARGLVALLDEQDDHDDPTVSERTEAELRRVLGHVPNTYYAIMLMDGDRMGRWVAGAEETLLTNAESWHPKVRSAAESIASGEPDLKAYLAAKRGPSPARHAAISAALSGFSQHLVPRIVEERFNGQLVYAGGDDVLAMVAVDHLLALMAWLRLAYSGIDPGDRADVLLAPGYAGAHMRMKSGFVEDRGRLILTMGRRATASIGAVIAHEREPLARVLTTLRQTERRAKEAGRDAFAITLLKRSGGPVNLTAPWGQEGPPGEPGWNLAGSPMGVLMSLRNLLAEDGMSRRAAYHAYGWLRHLPEEPLMAAGERRSLFAETLAYQFRRQAGTAGLSHQASVCAAALVDTAMAIESSRGLAMVPTLQAMLETGEFLARPQRAATAREPEAAHD